MDQISEREVSYEEGKNVAKQMGCEFGMFFESSFSSPSSFRGIIYITAIS